MKKSKINDALTELTKYKNLFISANVLSEYTGMENIEEMLTEEQVNIINKHNKTNFGTKELDVYRMVKKFTIALSYSDSITNACEEAGISIESYMKLRPIIYNTYNYAHELLDESEHYF